MVQHANEPAAPAFAHDKLLIVDFGSQVTQLIARRVREAGSIARSRRSTAPSARFAR